MIESTRSYNIVRREYTFSLTFFLKKKFSLTLINVSDDPKSPGTN